MDSVRSFRDLAVWQRSMDLAESIYTQTSTFPREEIYGMVSQMRRAATSIPYNIAEGHSRNTTGEFLQSLGFSRGSLGELETQIELAARLHFLPAQQRDTLLEAAAEISRMLSGLMRSLRSKDDPP